MTRLIAGAAVLVLLFTQLRADDAPDRAARFKAIRDDYEKARDEFNKAVRSGKAKPAADGEYPAWTDISKRFTQQARELIDADPADAVGLDALMFCLGDLWAGGREPDLYQLIVKNHVASKRLDPLLRRDSTPADFLRAVADKSPHAEIRLWATYHLAENLEAGGKPKEAEALLETLSRDGDAQKLGGYTGSHNLAGTAGRLLYEIRRLGVGHEVPEFAGSDLDGKPMKLSEFRGKVTLVVFWATWCGPCLKMVPHERALAERYAGRPFALLGVNGDHLPDGENKLIRPDGQEVDDSAAVKAAVEKHKITWRSFRGGQLRAAADWNVRAWPTVYLLDHRGVIRGKWKGDPGDKVLDAAVEKLVMAAEAETGKPNK